MNVPPQEAQENMLFRGPRGCSPHGDFDRIMREGFDASASRPRAVFEVGAQPGSVDTDDVEHDGGNEIVPRDEHEVAVNEEEDEEERGHEEVHDFEEFVETVARRV